MKESRNLFWQPDRTPAELYDLLHAVGEDYSVKCSAAESNIFWEKLPESGSLETSVLGDGRIRIAYGSLTAAARGIGLALAGRETGEKQFFRTMGIMLDCSRNAVMRVDYLKKWFCRLALLGYNMVMLYTEDTYVLPDEPYFGYLRGGYTLEEIRELDDFASGIGVELVGCIQTLGHLENAIRWGAFPNDTDKVLMVDDDRTYVLIGKMLDFWQKALRSRRIHVGMDETHSLGRGKFLDQHGYERRFDIFNRHLKRVDEQCHERGLEPIIWSDMYFRMGSRTMFYYDPKTVIPEEVREAIPRDVTLCYWDYYHHEQEFYEDWIERHRALGFEPHMASGIWTWQSVWYGRSQTESSVRPCLKACRSRGVKELYFTMWGDNGAFCDFDSAWAGLVWAADAAWNEQEVSDKIVANHFEVLCGTSYQDQLAASDLQYDLWYDGELWQLTSPMVLWDDPLLGIVWREIPHWQADVWEKALAQFKKVREALADAQPGGSAGDIGYARDAAEIIIRKIELRRKLLAAYENREMRRLKELREKDIPELIEAWKHFTDSFRRQWMRRNRPFGLEVMQIRMAGQIARCEELADRIGELLTGKIKIIDELEVKMEKSRGLLDSRFASCASGCFL